MFCKNCNSPLEEGATFCANCGQKITNVNDEVAETEVLPMNDIENVVKESTGEVVNEVIPDTKPEIINNSNSVEAINNTENVVQESTGGVVNEVIPDVQPGIIDDSNNAEPAVDNNVLPSQPRKRKTGLIITLIIVFVCIIVGLGIIFVPKLIPKNTPTIEPNNNEPTETEKSNKFYGQGYYLSYGEDWSETNATNTTSGEKISALKYKDDSIYITTLGNSALSEKEEEYDFDFDTETGKKQLFDLFYDYWHAQQSDLTRGSNGFSVLVDNTYIATMDFGDVSKGTAGQEYLIVNKDHNIIISLTSKIFKNYNDSSKNAIDLLKTITITKTFDDEVASYLESMSNWNRYSSLRSGDLAKKPVLEGGWRILSDSENYWYFKNGEFWWYKSYTDLQDNYWYGTVKVYKGKEGLTKIGIDKDKLDILTSNTNGRINEDNVYSIILTPKKIISNGEDKSSTNITGDDWHFVWVIVDHGSDGIEAQTGNIDTGDAYYYVKIKD